MGILDGAVDAPRSVRRVTRRGWITFDQGGLFVPAVSAGDTLAAGTALGASMDIHGREQDAVRVPADGIIIGLRRDPVVHTGERAAFVGYEWDAFDL
jgi:predicted deacylase